MNADDDEEHRQVLLARGVVLDVLVEVESKARRVRLITYALLIYVAILFTALGVYGFLEISKFNQIEQARSGLESHRVRNEIYHDCLHDYMKSITEAVGMGRVQDLANIDDTCPQPLTEEEILNLPHDS